MEFINSLVEFVEKNDSCISIYYVENKKYQIKSIWVGKENLVKRYIKHLMIIVKTYVKNVKFNSNIQHYNKYSVCSIKIDFNLETDPRIMIHAFKLVKHRSEFPLKYNYPEIIIGNNKFLSLY